MTRQPAKGEIMVYGGSYVNPLHIRAYEISLDWVAHSEANLGRYTGHTHRPTWGGPLRRIGRRVYNSTALYSVAQHSVLGSIWLEEQGASPEVQYGFLFHDSPEAVMNDFASPVKHNMPTYCAAERRIAPHFEQAFRVKAGYFEHPAVKHADRVMCATEQRDLMLDPRWENWPEPWDRRIEPWLPGRSKRAFLARYRVLWRRVQEYRASTKGRSLKDIEVLQIQPITGVSR